MAYQTFTHQIWWVMVCYDLAHQIRCAKHTFSGWCDIPPMVCCSFGGHSTPQFLQCAADPAPWSAGEDGLDAGLLHLPDQQHLQEISWERSVYVDWALPFGLRSAPKLFTAVADTIAWAFHRAGIEDQIHYLDDFLVLGPPPPATDVVAGPSQVPSGFSTTWVFQWLSIRLRGWHVALLFWALILTPRYSCCSYQQINSIDCKLF